MTGIALALLAGLQNAAAEQRPYLGVAMSPAGEEIQVGEQSFPFGVRVDQVVSGSGAAAAGLRVNDVIVAVAGVEPADSAKELVERIRAAIRQRKIGDTLSLTVVRDAVEKQARLNGEPTDADAAWRDLDELVGAQPPGTRLELTAERVRAVLTITATLGPAPEPPVTMKPMPSNEQILPEPAEHLPEERLADALVAEFGVTEDYDKFRARLAGVVTQGDPFRLTRAAYALREPFAMPALSRNVAAVPRDLPGLLAHGAACIDHPCPTATPPRLRTGLSATEHAKQIEQVLDQANDLYAAALADLSSGKQEYLRQVLPELCDAFRAYPMILDDRNQARRERVIEYMRLAAKVDLGKFAAAAVHLSSLLDADYLRGLRADLSADPEDIPLKHMTLHGPIVLAGSGHNWYREPAAVIVDLGGDDWYTQQTQRPFAVIIDLGGDDTYQSTIDYAQGATHLGVSLLYDQAGDDTYIGQRWSQGAAALGVGVLWDGDGNDTYRGSDHSQAAAFCGVGLLIDDAGQDRYDAPRYSQAFAMPGGFAALIERSGDDHYFCGGRDLTNYGTLGIFDAFGQGCGMGFRWLSSGGIALLLDQAGDDVYHGGNFAQGGGYYFGWGCLVDRAGNDRYRGSRYAQAFAAHQALGFLEDWGGDDVYEAHRGVGQSCSWDETVTVLLEHGGDDTYSGGGFALCAAHHNGFALFVDYAGRDRYKKLKDVPRADGDDNVTSFSLLLDLGGDEDRYPERQTSNVIRHGNRHGFLGDLPGDLEDAQRRLKDLIAK